MDNMLSCLEVYISRVPWFGMLVQFLLLYEIFPGVGRGEMGGGGWRGEGEEVIGGITSPLLSRHYGKYSSIASLLYVNHS